jgi:hypothetical protein
VAEAAVLTISDVPLGCIERLLERFGIGVGLCAADGPIPSSYWGEPEAGIVGQKVYVRPDTPLHSLLHEACHVICMTPARRATLARDAGSDDLEEAAVCYLEILLADELPGIGRARIMREMDAWGYSFRLGCAQRWFEDDSEDARGWLMRRRLIDEHGLPTFLLRAA